MGGSLLTATGPPFVGLQIGSIQHKFPLSDIVIRSCLNAPHIGAVCELRLCIGANNVTVLCRRAPLLHLLWCALALDDIHKHGDVRGQRMIGGKKAMRLLRIQTATVEEGIKCCHYRVYRVYSLVYLHLRPNVFASWIQFVLQCLQFGRRLGNLLHGGVVDLLVRHVLMVQAITILQIIKDSMLYNNNIIYNMVLIRDTL